MALTPPDNNQSVRFSRGNFKSWIHLVTFTTFWIVFFVCNPPETFNCNGVAVAWNKETTFTCAAKQTSHDNECLINIHFVGTKFHSFGLFSGKPAASTLLQMLHQSWSTRGRTSSSTQRRRFMFFRLRTMVSDVEVLILTLADSCLAANWYSKNWRSRTDVANRTMSSAGLQSIPSLDTQHPESKSAAQRLYCTHCR